MRSVANLTREQLPPDRGFEFALDHPPERPRAVDRVVAMLGEVVARLVRQFELDLALFEALAQPLDLRFRNSGRKCCRSASIACSFIRS